LKATGYEWWIKRLYFSMKRFDYVRLDHFRSFSAYYAIPQGKTALEGTWQKGGGPGFFRAVREALGTVGIIAEDLGALDNDVFNLICLLGYPGMNVWQFSDKEMQAMSPEKAKTRVFYSGTHDNQTLVSWCKDTDYALTPDEIIKELLSGDCPWVILQLQDVLSLDDRARLNIPGTPSGNWSWRCPKPLLTTGVARQHCRLVSEAGRL
ncbi:MAG: 4-alpha-glucanotransferase, partial [Parasporobacterium sp.]|nr:4-alpha-glucanotransferase [Parasporobacterium sp.]